MGLVTGNVESIGWAKMRALGIEQYFTTEPIRVELPSLAHVVGVFCFRLAHLEGTIRLIELNWFVWLVVRPRRFSPG